VWGAALNPAVLLDGCEAWKRRDRVRSPRDEKSGLPKGEVEGRHQPLLGGGAEAGHQRPGADEITASEWGVAGHVVLRERASTSNVRTDRKRAVRSKKETFEPAKGHILLDASWIRPEAGLPENIEVDVGPENPQRNLGVDLIQELQKADGERVDFLTGRAVRDPDAERSAPRSMLDEFGVYDALERAKCLRILEECGHGSHAPASASCATRRYSQGDNLPKRAQGRIWSSKHSQLSSRRRPPDRRCGYYTSLQRRGQP